MKLRRAIHTACILLALVGGMGETNAQTPANPLSYGRISSQTFDPLTGLLVSQTVEPDATNIALCLVTTYEPDGYGNATTITQANCPGSVPQRQQIAARTSSTNFAPATAVSVSINGAAVTLPKGLFPLILTNALGQSTTQEFDPRFGTVTKRTDPNNLVTTSRLDDFGRKTRESGSDGTSVVFFYCILGASGLDTSSNSPGCPSPSASEVRSDAVQFIHSEPRNRADAKMGPYARVYLDRYGREIRTATEAFDGVGQPGPPGSVVVTDTDFNQYGAKVVSTAAYFLSTNSSSTTGSNDYGMVLTNFDALGRVIQVDTADARGGVAGVSFGARSTRTVARLTYGFNGLTVTQTNDKGQAQVQEKDVAGRVVRITDPLGAQLVRQFDAFGNLVQTKDALQNLVFARFDYRGRRTQLNDPDAGLHMSEYDPLGELVWQQAPNQRAAAGAGNQQTTFSYDLLGRQTGRVDPEYAATWSHDSYANGSPCTRGIGQVCEITITNGVSRKFVFDSVGRLINGRTTISNGPSFASALSYDAITGRVASKTYPTGLTVNNVYTPKGFLEKLTLVQAASVTPLPATPGGASGARVSLTAGSLLWQGKAFNAAGQLEQSTTGNGINTGRSFEAATGRPLAISAGLGAATDVVNYSYTWDSLNNLQSRADGNGNGSSGAVTETFGYDGLNRLRLYRVAAPAIAGLSREVNLQYNALGNLLYKSDVGVYKYNPSGNNGSGVSYVRPHALQSISGWAASTSYYYDANGNLSSASAGKYQTLTYASFDLPDSSTGISGPSGNPDYVWSYDENHARLKEVRMVTAGTYAGTRTTWYLHPDQSGGLAFESELNSPTSPSASNPVMASNRHYLTAGGAHIGVLVSTGALPSLGAADTAPPSVITVGLVKAEYWHLDHLGSLVSTTDHAGAVTARYSYDPFGKRRVPDGRYDADGAVVGDWSPAVNAGTDRGYTGHEHLDDIGLIHMNGRLFDPTVARMLQADPIIQAPDNLQNYNRYTYCFNNPSVCTDPSGFAGSGSTLDEESRRQADDERSKHRDFVMNCAMNGGSLVSCDRQAGRQASEAKSGLQPGGKEKRDGGPGSAAKGAGDAAGNAATQFGRRIAADFVDNNKGSFGFQGWLAERFESWFERADTSTPSGQVGATAAAIAPFLLPGPKGGAAAKGAGTAFKDFNQARNAAVEWLETRGFKAEQATLGKFGDNASKPIGMKTADGSIGFRVEYEARNGAHINVWAGREKGPHFTFEGNPSMVDQIVKQFVK